MNDEVRPETALFLNEADSVLHIGRIAFGRMGQMADVVAVIHRGTETFTHVYLIPAAACRARREVRLLAVFPGEAAGLASRWAARRYGLAAFAEPRDRLAA